MANYEKPVIIDTEEHYEGVYAASGDNTDSGVSAPKCDSKYMNGVWHAPDYNNTTSYIRVSAVTDVRLSVTTAADSSLKNTGEATMLITATAIRTGSVSDTSLMMRLTGAMSVCANT